MSEAPRVFISYRREDTAGHAGRLYDTLVAKLGDDGNVFMDVDDIAPGVDFTQVLHDAVSQCDVLLALIGPRWVTVTSADGLRRLDDPNDYLTAEVGTALERDVRVIPVLIDNATMPAAADLPDRLAGLVHRNAMWLRTTTWRPDVESIVEVLGPARAAAPVAPSIAPPAPTSSPPSSASPSRTPSLIAAGALVLALIVAMIALTRDSGGSDTTATVGAGANATATTAAPELSISPTSGPIGTVIKLTGKACPDLEEGWYGGVVVMSLYDSRAVATKGDGTIQLYDIVDLEAGKPWHGEIDVPADGVEGTIEVRVACGANDPDDEFHHTFEYASTAFEITYS